MRVLVCGSRSFGDAAEFQRCMDRIAGVVKVERIIEGGARGADAMAKMWGHRRGLPVDTYEAQWSRHGCAAGVVRNRAMLEVGRPDLVVAFPIPESVGTWHMVDIARAAGVKTWVMPDDLAEVDAIGEGVFV